MAVVQQISLDGIAGRDQRQRARRRHPEVMHRFAAHHLADRGIGITARPSARREYGVGPAPLSWISQTLLSRPTTSPSVIARPSPS